jgi:hypothetical protein
MREPLNSSRKATRQLRNYAQLPLTTSENRKRRRLTGPNQGVFVNVKLQTRAAAQVPVPCVPAKCAVTGCM